MGGSPKWDGYKVINIVTTSVSRCGYSKLPVNTACYTSVHPPHKTSNNLTLYRPLFLIQPYTEQTLTKSTSKKQISSKRDECLPRIVYTKTWH